MPTVPDAMLSKWQNIVNVIARVLEVPAGLIMRLHEHEIEVFVSSETPENPFRPGDKEPLNSGLYCETVIAERRLLLVPNALKDPEWDHNPDIKLNMISYLGVPLLWPDGDVFGTICVLDQKENVYSELYQDLLRQFRSVIEDGLRQLVEDAQRHQSEQEKSLILKSISDLVIHLNRDLKVVWANDVAAESLGLTVGGMVGQYCYTLWDGSDEPCKNCPTLRAFESKELQEGELTTPDGRMWYLNASPIKDGAGTITGVVEVARNVTKSRLDRQALNYEVLVNSTLARLARALIESPSLDDISGLVLEAAQDLTGSAFGFVGYIDPATGYLICPTLTRDIWDRCEVPGKDVTFKTFGGLWGWVLDHKESLLTNDLAAEPRSTGIPQDHLPIERFLSVPALLDGALVGQIAVANPGRDYMPRDQLALERLADLYAVAVQNHRAVTALKLRSEWEHLIGETSRMFINQSPGQIDASVTDMLGQIVALTGGTQGVVYLVTEDGEGFVCSHAWHAESATDFAMLPERVAGNQYSIMQALIREQKTLVMARREDLPADPDLMTWVDEHRFYPSVYVPMVSGGSLFGILGVLDCQESEHMWPDEVVSALRLVGDILVNALERKHAEQAIRQYINRLSVLHDIDLGILQAQSPEAIAQAVLNFVPDLIPSCMRCSVMLADHEAQEYIVITESTGGTLGPEIGFRSPMALFNMLVDRMEGGILVRNNLEAVAEYSEAVRKFYDQGMRSMLHVMLTIRDEVVGMLNLGTAQLEGFSPEVVQIAREIGDQLAVALHQAQLYRQVQVYAAEMEQRVEDRTTELRNLNEHLLFLSQVKDEFVSNITHELRTPLQSLKLRHHILARQPDHVDEHLPVLRRETNRLENLIENLLFLSRLDQDRIALRPEAVDLHRLARQYVRDRIPLARERGQTLRYESERDETLIVHADAALLEEGLSVLLTNALNYTPKGGQVIVSTEREAKEGQVWIGLRVCDNGPGISPSEQDQLFKRFFRGAAGYESGMPGTGLGLSIVKEIVERHRGWIEVESSGVPGEGATFTVWLLPAASQDTRDPLGETLRA